MELETKMAEAPANCFPLKFHGILQNSDFPLGIQWIPQELMEEGKDLSNTTTITYKLCLAACGAGPFPMVCFSQQFSSWL